jgi:aminotransferase
MHNTNNNTISALEMSGFAVRTKGISRRVQNVTVSAIKEMMHLAERHPDAISLAQGTPSFKTPEHIRERVKQELDNNLNIGKYAPLAGLPELKQEIVRKLAKDRGIKADLHNEIYVTAGAMEAVASAIMTVVDKPDEVILLSPCFPSHIVQVILSQGTAVFVKLDKEKGWALDINRFKAKISDRTKAVVICNPANPTGTVFSEKDLRAVAELACAHDFWLITDEPYAFLVYDDRKFFSVSQIPEIKDRLIACFSFSKEYAMSGFRIGYVYAESGVINQMLKIHDAFVITAATPCQYAALQALRQGSKADIAHFKAEFAKKRDLICQCLDQLSDLFSYQKPEGAYYIFPEIKVNIGDFELAIKLLEQAKVVTVPGSAFGPGGEGHLRFSYAQSPDDINKAFDRIEEWWKKNRSKYSLKI